MNPGFLSYGGSVTTPEYSSAVADPAENGLNAARTAGPRAAGSPSGFCILGWRVSPDSSASGPLINSTHHSLKLLFSLISQK